MKPICCQSLSKSYGNKQVLNDVEFSVDAKDSVALIGPNGAGKTTLFNMLCGFSSPDSGSIKVFGHSPSASALFGKVSALPQDAQLDPRFSVAQQLQFFAQLQGFNKRAAKHDVERVLALVDLSTSANTKPSELSHGMRKRITIAQALIGTPELIFLDEPTAGLDPANAMAVRQLISRLNEQATLIISSHNLSELERLCNKVLLLNQGKIEVRSGDTDVSNEQIMTLQLLDNSNNNIESLLRNITGVQSVVKTERSRYRIHYQQIDLPIDQQLLQCLAQNGVEYKQLIKGQTLEERLYATD